MFKSILSLLVDNTTISFRKVKLIWFYWLTSAVNIKETNLMDGLNEINQRFLFYLRLGVQFSCKT